MTGLWSDRKAIGAALLLFLSTCVAYHRVWNAGFIWDDDDYVTENAALRSVDGLRRIWFEPGAVPQYYPMTFTSLWLEYRLWGLQPRGYHVDNVLLHALNAILLWLILRQLAVPAAWFAAAVFALHPMQVESVAWVTERKNVLAGVFALSAMLVYLRHVVPTPAGEGPSRGRPYYALTCLLFACALWSKTVTCTLPAVLLLIQWWKNGKLDARVVLPLLPLFLLGMGMGGITVWMERNHVGAAGREWDLSILERSLVAGRVLWFYASTLLWPHPLTFIYPRWQIDLHAWWQSLYPIASVTVLITLFAMKERIGRGPFVAVAIYAGTLFPALGFINVYPMIFSFVADHFAYFPIAALMVLSSAALAPMARRWQWIGRGAGACVLAILLMLTVRQTSIYRDLPTLWTDTLNKNPACWMAHNNMGTTLVKAVKGQDASLMPAGSHDPQELLARARYHLEEAVRLRPEFPEAHNNLGTALRDSGDLDSAVEHWRKAAELRPGFADPHSNLGGALAARGQFDEAIEEYRQALRLNPNYVEARSNLGEVLRQRGRVDEAIQQGEEAVRLQPDRWESHLNLGMALADGGQSVAAIAQFEESLRLHSASPVVHNILGITLARSGKLAEALVHLEEATRLQPQFAEAQYNLAVALEQAGDLPRALDRYQQATRLTPNDAQAWTHLALAYLKSGRRDEALASASRAVVLAKGEGQSDLIARLAAEFPVGTFD